MIMKKIKITTAIIMKRQNNHLHKLNIGKSQGKKVLKKIAAMKK